MNTQPHKKLKILLIGDNCLDVYQFGIVDRLSPEAPVPIFVPLYKEERSGMVGNVHNNLINLDCEVTLYSGKTSIKKRLIDTRSKQQIMRVDKDIISEPLTINDITIEHDAIIISDYNKGLVTYELIEDILAVAKCPVFIDTKLTDLSRMQGAWVKINNLEYSKIKSECSGLIVTNGSSGASVIHHDIDCPAPKVEVVDVTGAGDTFLSALAYQYLITNDIKSAVKFAINASSITVQHLGVYAPTLNEIRIEELR